MVRIAAGLIFLANPLEVDKIISDMQKQYDIELLHVETSYGKLWITRSDRQEGEHAKD